MTLKRFEGRAIRLGDDVNTDNIISYRYKSRTIDPKELAKHVFEDIDPELPKKIRPGDIVVAGKNFGYGSSREHAPLAIKGAGIRIILAESFARIFYRNAVNLGLLLFTVPHDFVEKTRMWDNIVVDLEKGKVYNVNSGVEAPIKLPPEFMWRIVEAGGIVGYYRKHGRLPWEESQ